MNKKLYICGDSFGTLDSEYGSSWAESFAKLHPNVDIVNLCVSGASNYHIHLQVKTAIKEHCDYLIYLATSSIRQEFALQQDVNFHGHDSINRYWNIQNPDNSKSVISTSWVRPQERVYNEKQQHDILDFFGHYMDFVSVIEKNYIFIDYTLMLINKELPRDSWAWTRGGFEHKTWGDNNRKWDFSNFNDREITINLWDYYDPKTIRPYYHINDTKIIKKVCDQYSTMLKLQDV
jgi:hypothetical protein